MNSFDLGFQKLILRYMLQDPQLFSRVSSIYNPENFDKGLRLVAEFIQVYADQYRSLPDTEQIKAATGTELSANLIENIENKKDWALDTFEKFTKQKTLERAILKSADMLEKAMEDGIGNFDPIEKLIKDAVQIGLTRNLGTDYFEDPRSRLMALKDSNGQISTGLKTLNEKLYGGFNKKELNIVCAASGGGKSLFMQNIACNWVLAGLNGVYITLELREELCGMRMDSMLTGITSKSIFKEMDDVELKLKMLQKKSGDLRIKFLPAQSNVNHIKSYIKELQIQTGMTIDFICIDYLDLLMPAGVKINPSDVFQKDKHVAEELRNMAYELNVACLTAAQLNRSGVDEVEFDHSHIAGGISKIYTADNVFALFTSRSMRERGRYQLQFLKTRNSGSVGDKIDLGFDLESLRFFDVEEEASPKSSINDILNQVKGKSSSDGMVIKPKVGVDPFKVSNEAIAGRNKGQVQSGQLRDMLNSLKSEK